MDLGWEVGGTCRAGAVADNALVGAASPTALTFTGLGTREGECVSFATEVGVAADGELLGAADCSMGGGRKVLPSKSLLCSGSMAHRATPVGKGILMNARLTARSRLTAA